MPKKDDAVIFSITSTIKDIPRGVWDGLFGRELAEGYGYHKTLEESGLNEFGFGYLVGKRNGQTIAIFPFYALDFSFTTLIQGPLQSLILALQRLIKNFMRPRLLFVGSPTTEEFYLGLAGEEELAGLLDGAINKLEEFCRENKIGNYLFYNLSQKNSLLIELLIKRGFGKMENFPTTIISINAASVEEYTGRLSKNTRKDLKKKLKKAAQDPSLVTEVLDDLNGNPDEIYRLYLNNFDGSDVHFEKFTPRFFRDIFTNMPGVAKLFITRSQGKIAAFNLCLVKDGLCIDKVIGFDPAVSRALALYHYTFCYNIAWCIKNGINLYQPGITDYHSKLRMGAKLVPLYILAKSLNPLVNQLVKPALKLIQPKNFDPTLKRMELAEGQAGVIPAKG